MGLQRDVYNWVNNSYKVILNYFQSSLLSNLSKLLSMTNKVLHYLVFSGSFLESLGNPINHFPFSEISESPSIFQVCLPITTLVNACILSHVHLFVTPWIIALQAPLFIGFFRQEYWSVLPVPSSGDLPNPVIEPKSPACEFFTSEPPRKPLIMLVLWD